MKRFFTYIYIMFAAVIGITACDIAELGGDTEIHEVEPETVTFDFEVRYAAGQSQQVWTKAFADKPDIENLRLAVFDATGYLESYVLATEADGHVIDNKIENKKKYTATLPIIDSPVSIHFIANGPATIDFGDATSVIGSLYTQDRQDAYWAVVDLPNGIQKNKNTQALEEETAALLTDIPLVRNFAKVTITTSQNSGITLEGAYVMNNADRGSIAPYNRSAGDFIKDYRNYQNTDTLISKTHYDAFVPVSRVLNTHVPDVSEFNTVDSNGAAYDFIYERETPSADAIYIIIKAKYQDDAESSYYKVDMRDPEENYFPVLRNFDYKINIKKVYKRGSATPEEASNSIGSGDISTAIENEELTNISNGQSRIFVSYTDTTVVTTDQIYLKYRFIPDMNHSDVDANQTTNTSGVSYTKVELGEEDPVLGPAVSLMEIEGSDDAEGYRTICITPAGAQTNTNEQSITITGYAYDSQEGTYSTIARKVNIYVREVLNMIVSCDPYRVANTMGKPVDVVVKIPAGLPKMMFPLTFSLEAQKLSVTPNNDNLPVIAGKSIISPSKSAFQFTKELSFDDYSSAPTEVIDGNNYKTFRCHFKTNMTASATDIYVANQYFTTQHGAFINYDPADYKFTGLTFSPAGPLHLDDETTFSFTMTNCQAGMEVTVTLDGFRPADTETELIRIGNTNQYTYTPHGVTGNSFKLTALDYEGQGTVTLSSELYEDASKSVNFEGNKFTNLALDKFVGSGIGSTTNFTFHIDELPGSEGITLTLDGLEPQSTETRLVSKGNNQYKYVPAATGDQPALKLQSTIAKGNATVTLSAFTFETNSVTRKVGGRKITIANANNNRLKFTSSGSPFSSGSNTSVNGTYVYVRYEMYPEDIEQNNPGAPRTSISKSESGMWTKTYSYYNADQIVLNEVDFNVETLYFFYRYNSNWYVGTLDVSGCVNDENTIGGETITFSARKTKGELTISNFTKTVGENWAINPNRHNSNGDVTYTIISGADKISINGGNITANKVGTARVHAVMAETNSYSAAECDFTVEVQKGNGTLTVTVAGNTVANNDNVRVGTGKSKSFSATTNNPSGNITITSSNPAVAKVENGQLVGVASGNATITVSLAGDSNYNGTSMQFNVTVSQRRFLIEKSDDFVTVGGGYSVYNASSKEPVKGETARITVYVYDDEVLPTAANVKFNGTAATAKTNTTKTIDGLTYTAYYLDVPTSTAGITNYNIVATNTDNDTASTTGQLYVWDITRAANEKQNSLTSDAYYVIKNRDSSKLLSCTNNAFKAGSNASSTTGLNLEDLWVFSGTTSGTIKNVYNNRYIYGDSISQNSTNWTYNWNNSYFRFRYTSGNTYYLYRNNSDTNYGTSRYYTDYSSRQFHVYLVSFVRPTP